MVLARLRLGPPTGGGGRLLTRRPRVGVRLHCLRVSVTIAVYAGAVACGSPVFVAVPTRAGADAVACRHLLAQLPDRVAGQAMRPVAPGDASAAAWGDPPIVLRCGVPRPAALTPTSACPVLDHVGWLAVRVGEGWRFTTIGRSVYVEMSVPGSYQPASDALVDVAGAVRATTTWPHPCR